MGSLAESVREQPAMPRFEGGSVNLRELMRRIAEDVVNAIMDARGRPAVRGRCQQPQRLPRAQPGHARRRHHDEDTEAEVGELLPRGHGRALPARRPCGRVGGGQDVRHRHLDAQGAAHRGEAGDIQAVEGPGQRQSATWIHVVSHLCMAFQNIACHQTFATTCRHNTTVDNLKTHVTRKYQVRQAFVRHQHGNPPNMPVGQHALLSDLNLPLPHP